MPAKKKQLDDKQKELLRYIFYDEMYVCGTDKMYKYIMENYPQCGIRKYHVKEWLSEQGPYLKLFPNRHNNQWTEDKSKYVTKRIRQKHGLDTIEDK